MAFIDITEELQYGYELNRHYCNDMILNATTRIGELLVIRDERAMHHFLKDFIDVGASIATIVKGIYQNFPPDRIIDEVNFQISELIQGVYFYVDLDDNNKVVTIETKLDRACVVETCSDLDHIEYVLADELLDWAADTVDLIPRSLKEVGDNIHRQYAEVADFTEETSLEFCISDGILLIK